MTDPRAELAALVAEARALVQAAISAGHTYDATPEPASSGQRAEAATLSEIRGAIGDCQRCGLCHARTNLVFGDGAPRAELMVIASPPGRSEDELGAPCTGEAGDILDKMLENVIGLTRAQVYITNIVKCRPPGDRAPLPDEVARCQPFLQQQIDAIGPRAILVLGEVAFQGLLATSQELSSARGRWHEHRGISVMPTFHPAFLLQNPGAKRPAFSDLKELRARLDALRASG